MKLKVLCVLCFLALMCQSALAEKDSDFSLVSNNTSNGFTTLVFEATKPIADSTIYEVWWLIANLSNNNDHQLIFVVLEHPSMKAKDQICATMKVRSASDKEISFSLIKKTGRDSIGGDVIISRTIIQKGR